MIYFNNYDQYVLTIAIDTYITIITIVLTTCSKPNSPYITDHMIQKEEKKGKHLKGQMHRILNIGID